MTHILERILEAKRREVERSRAAVPLEEMIERSQRADVPRGFERALRAKRAAGRPAVIAEIKRASPSRGLTGPISILLVSPLHTKPTGRHASRY